jgi:hypothetical protein
LRSRPADDFCGSTRSYPSRVGETSIVRLPWSWTALMNSAALTKLAAGLLCLPLIGMVHAADKSRGPELRQIDIRVQAGGFGGASAADITAVLQSAAGELCRYWPGTQLPRIDVYHRPDHPQTDSRRGAGNRIAIGLTAQGQSLGAVQFSICARILPCTDQLQ